MTVTRVVDIETLAGVRKKSVRGKRSVVGAGGKVREKRNDEARWSLVFFWRKGKWAHEVEGGSAGGWEVEGVQGTRGVGGALLHDAGGGGGDEGVASVWGGGG